MKILAGILGLLSVGIAIAGTQDGPSNNNSSSSQTSPWDGGQGARMMRTQVNTDASDGPSGHGSYEYSKAKVYQQAPTPDTPSRGRYGPGALKTESGVFVERTPNSTAYDKIKATAIHHYTPRPQRPQRTRQTRPGDATPQPTSARNSPTGDETPTPTPYPTRVH